VCGDLFKLGVVAFIIYIVYKSCIATPSQTSPQGDGPPPSYDDTFRQQDPQGNQSPPPYGFRQDYMPNTGSGGGMNT